MSGANFLSYVRSEIVKNTVINSQEITRGKKIGCGNYGDVYFATCRLVSRDFFVSERSEIFFVRNL